MRKPAHSSASTLISADDLTRAKSDRVPCLTVLHHPDPSRVGHRAALRVVSLGHPAFVSRDQPHFSAIGSDAGRPLEDPHVSRTPFVLKPSADGGIEMENLGTGVRVEGQEGAAKCRLSPGDMARGIVLELGGGVLLLVHLATERARTPVAGILGQSDAIDDVRREILRVADLDTAVLIRGETGVGKERVAQAIHQHSRRATAEYVAVNMAAIPESIAASALFGHMKGAFTGAQHKHRGFFERASGGTLLLDEIGDTPKAVQPMLLRAIETRLIVPLGEERERRVDVRLLAATDADLEDGLESDSFSAALLHRLAGYEIHVPPLRNRREDVPLLFRVFLAMESEVTVAPEPHRDRDVPCALMSRIVRHPWPGNVRQLHNFARHLAIANRGADSLRTTPAVDRLLAVEDRIPERPAASPALHRRPRDIGDDELLATLSSNGWSPGRTAAALGIPTGSLHSLMRRCPRVRRAADVGDAELCSVHEACSGDTGEMAARLRVSERGLRIALKQRGLPVATSSEV